MVFTWTDDPLVENTIIKGVHITEMWGYLDEIACLMHCAAHNSSDNTTHNGSDNTGDDYNEDSYHNSSYWSTHFSSVRSGHNTSVE